jgi:hypothetical protein
MATESFSHAIRLYNSRSCRCYADYSTEAEMSSSGNPAAAPLDPTTRVTTDGSIARSSDPSTDDRASIGQKLKGNLAGAVKGTVGSIQGVTGTISRNKDLEEKGTEKMQEEDQRLAAKRGVPPVGSGQRLTKEDEQL